jgi:dihydroflavonol-4-reductase
MTTLVTGATGFVGQWIAREAAGGPGKLRVLARRSSDLSALEGVPVEVVEGDLLDAGSLQRALAGVRQVYHAAGWISFKRRDGERVRAVNYEGTATLWEAALAAGVERVVYTASIFALGHAEGPEQPATEGHEFNGHDLLDIPYLRAKVEAEEATVAAMARGLPLIRLYPGLCLGPGDTTRSSSAAIDAWLRGRLPAVVSGGGICLMDVRDAARAHVAAMERGVPGRRYLATGHNVTLEQLFGRLEAMTGRRAPRLRVPARVAVPLADVAERLNVLTAFDRAQARLMARYWWYDNRRAEEELGVRFRPLDETLRDTVRWLRDGVSGP